MWRGRRIIVIGSGRLSAAAVAALRDDGADVMQIPQTQISRLSGADIQVRKAGLVIVAPERAPMAWDGGLRQLAELARGCRGSVLLLADAATGVVPAAALPGGVRQLVVEEVAARRLLASWPLHLGFDPPFGQMPHLLIAGRTPLAEALLVHVLRIGLYAAEGPALTLLDQDPEAWRAALAARFPQASETGRLRFRALDAPALESLPLITGAVVCIQPPPRALSVAERLAVQIAEVQHSAPPLFLELGTVEPRGELVDWDGQLIPFSAQRLALRRQVLLDGAGDELARVIHDHYRDTAAAQGRDLSAEPGAQPWDALADSYRGANRQQADHLSAKLAVTDCLAVPEELVESFAFAPAEVERLAVVEHSRWAADRYLDGWRYAPERDNASKHHPQLVPYDALSGPMKDLDRFAVRLVPALLARSGLGVVRMLIVGVEDPEPAPAAGPLRGQMDAVLRRLRARYPDRALVVASTLDTPAARLFARRALELLGATLFVLCPRPLTVLRKDLSSVDTRRELLRLVGLAARRVPLPADGELDRWLALRAEVRIALSGTAALTCDDGKWVRIDSDRGVSWSFDY